MGKDVVHQGATRSTASTRTARVVSSEDEVVSEKEKEDRYG